MSLLSQMPSAAPDAAAPAPLRRELAVSLGTAAIAAGLAAYALVTAFGLDLAFLAGTAVAFAAVAAAALRGLDDHAPHRRLGDANRTTLGRGVLVALVAGALVLPEPEPAARWLFAALAVAALALDGVDGWLARRHGTASDYGARFDMGLDTLFTLALALLLWRWDEVGLWALLAGLLRYLFVAAGWLWPALAAPLPFSRRRRFVCALSVGVLAAAISPVVAPPATGIAVGVALVLLLFSFAVDTVWLVRRAGPGDRETGN